MASINPSTTPWLYYDYRTATVGIEHTVQVRPASLGVADRLAAEETLLGVLEAFGVNSFRSTWRVFACRAANTGSDFTAPAGFLAGLDLFTGSSGGTYPPSQEAVEMRFVGRSPTTGVKVSFSLFGIATSITIGTFRLQGAAAGQGLFVRNAVNVLNTSGGALRCVDGSEPIWYEYVNLQYNSYWERRIRIGG